MTSPRKPLRSLVVGYGSIGARHEAVLRGLGAPTAVVSRHAGDWPCPRFPDVAGALAEFRPEYVVVSNRTSEHVGTLQDLENGGFRGFCLVEKPLAVRREDLPPAFGFQMGVGYVLRFHPLMAAAAKILSGKRLLSIHAYVGQYLPDWRPGTDYRQCYSAHKEQGGGALRDLSHELDYVAYLAGDWRRVAAIGGHLSQLEIDSDDAYLLLLETQRCPAVGCQLNYLDRNLRRDCSIQYEGGTLHLDFIGQRWVHNGVAQSFPAERNGMIAAMHQAAWGGGGAPLCTYAEAGNVLALIDAAQEAAQAGTWICHKKNQ